MPIGSKSAASYFEKAKRLADAKKYSDALQALNKLHMLKDKRKLELSPQEHTDLHFLKGQYFYKLKKYFEACAQFEECYLLCVKHGIHRGKLSNVAELVNCYRKAEIPDQVGKWMELEARVQKKELRREA